MAITDVPEFAHLTDADIENLAVELDAIRQDIEDSRGERDARYIRRTIAAQRALEVAGRVMRFEVARHLLCAPHRPRLADVAICAGFYDQAHLHREWRELAGCTPSWWLAEEFPSVHDSRLDQEALSTT